MKKCPFCKNEIESNVTDCPICKMILVEKVDTARPKTNQTYTPPPPKQPKEQTHTYNTNYTTPSPSKKRFQFPKINIGKSLLYFIIGSVVLTAILNYHSSSNPLPNPSSSPDSNGTQNSSTGSSLLPIQPDPTIAQIPVPEIKNIPPIQTTPDVPYYSLPNGTVLYASPSLNGLGILTITNGTSLDATVKLITSGVGGQKVYWVYIRANNSYSIKNINDGIYRVLFSSGSNWDVGQRKFLVNPSAEFFDDNFDFETSDTQSTRYTLTLNPVVGGTATTSTIDPSEFDKY